MQRIRKVAVAAMVYVGVVGCVTTHFGPELKNGHRDLAVSCSDDYSNDHTKFTGIVCTIENTTDGWLNVELGKLSAKDTSGGFPHVSTPREIIDFRYAS